MLAELTPELVRAGWDVTVLTGAGETPVDVHRVGEPRVRVVRVGSLPFGRGHLVSRLLEIVFLYPMFFFRALRLGRFDVVVTKTDPPFLPVIGALLRLLTGARLVHWAQDLYPEIAEAIGIIRPDGSLACILRGASSAALRRYDRVVAVGRCMQERIQARGVTPGKVAVIPNWPIGRLQPVPRASNAFRRRHGLGNSFVVMYSGNMGRVHTFEPILDAAVELRERSPAIRFVLVGDGPKKDWIRRQIRARDLHNVMLLPTQPGEALSQSLSAADLHVITMHENACGLVVPSKLYGAMAVGRPCLFVGPARSEAARFIRETGSGTVVEQPTGIDLAHQILIWCCDPLRCEAAGRNAYLGVREARSSAFQAFKRLLAEIDDGSPTITQGRPHIPPELVAQAKSRTLVRPGAAIRPA